MQIFFTLRPEKPLIVPFNYNYQLQSAIYALLGTVGESDFWHDTGFGPAPFKGFCFGPLQGEYRADTETRTLSYAREVRLEVRSPVFSFIDALQRAVERRPYLKLFDTGLSVVQAELTNRHLEGGGVKLTAVTPVVAHSTAENGKTYFYAPDEPAFYEHLCANARRKYEAIAGRPAPQIQISLCGSCKKTVTRYKGMLLTGYTGDFRLETALSMAEFIYNAGLGEKNAQGFGFVAAE